MGLYNSHRHKSIWKLESREPELFIYYKKKCFFPPCNSLFQTLCEQAGMSWFSEYFHFPPLRQKYISNPPQRHFAHPPPPSATDAFRLSSEFSECAENIYVYIIMKLAVKRLLDGLRSKWPIFLHQNRPPAYRRTVTAASLKLIRFSTNIKFISRGFQRRCMPLNRSNSWNRTISKRYLTWSKNSRGTTSVAIWWNLCIGSARAAQKQTDSWSALRGHSNKKIRGS